jgi:hypothetical protein
MQSHLPLSDARLESLARKRAGMRLGWIVHAGVFVAVNLLLAALSLLSGRAWAIYPFLGWGLGLTIHGIVVLAAMPGGSLLERLVRQERQRLAARNEPS